jgi:Tfp pilus assembly pilus retraction ATPase PilT
MEDGTTLNPSNYMLYLGQLMINKNSSDIYFTYGEEPALRIFGEVHRVMNAPKLGDPTLEAITKLLTSEEDRDLYRENLSCDL